MTQRLTLPIVLLTALGCATPDAPPADSSASGNAPADQASTPQTGGVVNIYSARHYDADFELYKQFEAATGIKVQTTEADSAALLERLNREGEASDADLFMAVDAGRLAVAEQQGIFEPISSSVLEARIPAKLRQRDGLWFGVTKRARVIVYANDRVQPGEITRYEDLADPQWRDRVLIRSSSNIYNQSLMASIMAAHGEEAAQAWCEGLVANLARTPQGGDRDQVRAVAAGEGDVAVVNSYYVGMMLAADAKAEDQAAARGITIVFPNQDDRGTHVNISGGGLVRGAPNRDNAIRFLEFLTEADSQAIFARLNKEYPVVEGIAPPAELGDLASFVEDPIDAAAYGAAAQSAFELMDRCGWR